jgi:Flp pilus assembly pilin Flp
VGGEWHGRCSSIGRWKQKTIRPVLFTSLEWRSGFEMLNRSFERFWKDEDGQSIVEYSLLLVLIAATSVLMLTMLGLSISRMFGMNEFTVETLYKRAYEKQSLKE